MPADMNSPNAAPDHIGEDRWNAAASDRYGGRGEAGFHGAAIIGVVLMALLLFVAALYAAVSGREGRDPGDARAPSANGVSAVGLGAFTAFLEARGRSVWREAEAGAPRGGIVILSDARAGTDEQRERLNAARFRLHRAESVLLVLPKWRIPRGSFGRRFAREIEPAHRSGARRALQSALDSLGFDEPSVERLSGSLEGLARNPLGVEPTIETPQLMRAEGLEPVIARADGAMLLGRADFGDDGLPRLYVLSDPDPLLNHGIDDGDNALFAERLLAALGPPGAAVGIDDGPAPPGVPPNFWAALFEPPLAAVSIAILGLFTVIGLIAVARFGGREADRPGQAAGKEALLDASAALLRQGDGDRAVIRRFFDETLKDVGARLHAPDLSERAGLVAWLTGQEAARAPQERLAALETRLTVLASGPTPRDEALTALARDINAWREEMLRGHA